MRRRSLKSTDDRDRRAVPVIGSWRLIYQANTLNARFPSDYMQQELRLLAFERSPVADLGLDEHVTATLEILKRLAASGKVILVGHSMSGAVITRVGEMAPSLIERLICLTAYCPVRLPNALAYNGLPEHAQATAADIFLGDPTVTGAVRLNPRSADPAYLDEIRRTFYHDVPADIFLAFARGMLPDLPLKVVSADARGTAGRWGLLPRSFVRCTEDRAIPIALQDRMIREADEVTPGNPFDVKTLASSHSPFASRPEQVAEILATVD